VEARDGRTDGQTDRQMDGLDRCMMGPPSRKDGPITILLITSAKEVMFLPDFVINGSF